MLFWVVLIVWIVPLIVLGVMAVAVHGILATLLNTAPARYCHGGYKSFGSLEDLCSLL